MLVAAFCVGCAQPSANVAAEPEYRQWKLPHKLREISGLAEYQGRLFTHDDQLGIVYEVDLQSGELVKAFALGDPTTEDDFEGIAVADDTFYLVNSDGRIYQFGEGSNGERVPFQSFDTGLGAECEVEGLDYTAASNQLLLACKQARNAALRRYVSIYAFSLQSKQLDPHPLLRVPVDTIPVDGSDRRFNPSGLVVMPPDGNLLLVAARQHALLELDSKGRVVRRMRLPRQRHRQAEGIELMPDGRLVIADEGGNQRARLTLYESLPQ